LAAQAGHALDGPHAAPFKHHRERQYRVVQRRPHFGQGPGVVVNERLIAESALVPLSVLSVAAVLMLGRVMAGRGDHGELAILRPLAYDSVIWTESGEQPGFIRPVVSLPGNFGVFLLGHNPQLLR